MKTNPGGTLDPKDVIGRDKVKEKMWRTLENQGIQLASERRVGKTSILRKMEAEGKEGLIALLQVIQGVRSPIEFVGKIVEKATPLLSKKGKVFTKLQVFYEKVAGQKVGDWTVPEIKNHWKDLLLTTFKDIEENIEETVVFMWDEFPLMISNVAEDHGQTLAKELLDTLRDYRNQNSSSNIRMVYCGSIGFHHILKKLRITGYKNDPTNDLYSYPLEGLTPEDGRELALKLIKGEGIQTSESIKEIAQSISHSVDNLPFYIHHIIRDLSDNFTVPVSPNDVEKTVQDFILNPEDKAHFEQYRDRIDIYYEDLKEYAFLILDILCNAENSLNFEKIRNLAASQTEIAETEPLRETLKLLVKDHYLSISATANDKKLYQFKYSIIKRWWKSIRR